MPQPTTEGQITTRDETTARIVTVLPWFSFFVVSLIPPLTFLGLFFAAATTEAAAVYLFLTLLAAAIGTAAALLLLVGLMFYRKRWLQRLRDKLAADGVTASEVPWFLPELTTAERQTLRRMKKTNPLLGDAYSEVLASRLMATRLVKRTRDDLLLVERRLNKLALLRAADTSALQKELQDDHAGLTRAHGEATVRLAETQARMQMVEAAASRDLSHSETYLMLQRLTAAQDHLPLTLEIAQLERHALAEAEQEIQDLNPG